MTDRNRQLLDLLHRQAEAEAEATRRLARVKDDTAARLSKLLARWSQEDEPDGPLFGGLPQQERVIVAPTHKKGNPYTAPTGFGYAEAPAPARQSARHDKQLVTVHEWIIWHRHTHEQVGTVNATTHPSALALAVDRFGPDVLVRLPGEGEATAQVPAETSAAGAEVSWDAACTFDVTLADGSTVGCTWHPDHAYANGCGEPGRLELRGPVSPEGFRAMPIPPSQRNEPLAEVARRRAQEAADCEARRLASPEKVKEPSKRKRKKVDAKEVAE